MEPQQDAVPVGKLNPRDWVGRQVSVVIDRPIGSHHPKHGALYEINYGYIPGYISPDNEELDVYVLGPSEPIASCQAVVIAVISRHNDVEDKLIASVGSKTYSLAELQQFVKFQECFYDSEILL